MICAICRREARGWGFAPELIRREAPPLTLCSRRCQDITAKRKGMIDPTSHEREALAQASAQAGAYIEALGTTNLAHWSPEAWEALIALIVTAFQDALRQAYDEDPPF